MDFRARIVGDGPLRAKLEKLAGHLGVADRVTFAGQVPSHEVWGHLDWADVLLHTGVVAPSGDRDGLPNVIAEAMAAGVPVVTSPTAGTTEAVKDGVTGVVLPVDRPEAWVACAAPARRATTPICESLRRPRAGLGRGQLRRAREHGPAPTAAGGRRGAMIFFDTTERLLAGGTPRAWRG